MTPSNLTARQRDEFLTSPEVALALVSQHVVPRMKSTGCTHWIEPSAGAGSFINAFAAAIPGLHTLALDLHPQHPDVQVGNFFSWEPPWIQNPSLQPQGDVWIVGNPPFGKNSSLALRFLNQSVQWAQWVAFILPKTFRKESMKRRLDARLECILDVDVDSHAFLFENKPYDVPCMFAIYKVHPQPLALTMPAGVLTCPDFDFVTSDVADLSFQRVGVGAGTVRSQFQDRSPSSHYFLKAKPHLTASTLIQRLQSLDWSIEKTLCAGNPSIPKRALIAQYMKLFPTSSLNP